MQNDVSATFTKGEGAGSQTRAPQAGEFQSPGVRFQHGSCANCTACKVSSLSLLLNPDMCECVLQLK